MTVSARLDVARLLRIATLACAAGAAMLVHGAFAPRFDALRGELADAQRQLRSDEVNAQELTRLARREPELAARYAAPFSGNAQAGFLTELARTLRYHRVTLASTSASAGAQPGDRSETFQSAFPASHLGLELDGSYRDIVGAIAELSEGPELVRVEAPSFHRTGARLGAVVPVTIYDPSRPASPAPVQSEASPP
jgi:hypothetical protein